MASIRKRKTKNHGTVYDVVVCLGRDGTKKQIIKRKTFRPPDDVSASKARALAEEFAAEFEKNQRVILSGSDKKKRVIFKNFYLEYWQNWIGSVITPPQKLNYMSLINHHVPAEIFEKYADAIAPADVQMMVLQMQKTMSASTIHNAVSALSSVMNYAVTLGYAEKNPCQSVRLPPIKRDVKLHYWTVEQCISFMNFVKENCADEDPVRRQWPALFALLIYGSFRRGEALAMQWGAVDLESGSVSVVQSVTRMPGENYIKAPKTEAGIRVLSLPAIATDELKHLLELKAGRQCGADEYIFQQRFGGIVSPSSVSHVFKKFIRQYNARDQTAPLPDIHLHDLRHTGITLLLAAGVDIETVSHRAGHSRCSVTVDVYGQYMRELDKSAADKLQEMFSENKKKGK